MNIIILCPECGEKDIAVYDGGHVNTFMCLYCTCVFEVKIEQKNVSVHPIHLHLRGAK